MIRLVNPSVSARKVTGEHFVRPVRFVCPMICTITLYISNVYAFDHASEYLQRANLFVEYDCYDLCVQT